MELILFGGIMILCEHSGKPTLLFDRWSIGPSHIFGFPFCQRLWTVTERPQRLVTFVTFDQSDEGK